jgi:hypothetical protein
MNFTTENAIEMPVNAAPISAILDETDTVLSDCLVALDKLNACICGATPLEEKKADPRCMRDCVMLTADKARLVRSGIAQVMEAIGV